ncbi:hypothetical protein EV426DRAFT_188790 [Tirmania nivea]|nr:hypothetical protein EV426DRAFT_188790 [Tirmania nivea]
MKNLMSKALHSGGRKRGGDHGQQPSNQHHQPRERDSGKSPSKVGSKLKSLFSSEKSLRNPLEARTTIHARPHSQSDTATAVSDTPVTSSGTINITAASIPVSEPQTSSTQPQAVGYTNCISNTKNDPVSPSIFAQIWQKALEIALESLAKYELPSLEIGSFQSQCAMENIQSLLAELDAAHREHKNRQWRYKDRRGNEVVWMERIGKILKSVDKYAKIVDTAIQHHPDVTSLVWAGARTILQVALNHVEAMEYFEGAMVTIMDKMAVSAFYAGIYTGVGLQTAMGDTGKLYEVLNMALPELYAAVIVFAIKARQYFEARWIEKAVNMLKPFAIEFQPFIDDITGKEKTVHECADMAMMERIRSSSEKIAEMETLLIDMRTEMKPLLRLNEISDTLTENVKVSKELLKRSLDAEDEQLLQLLSPLEPLKRHADVRSIRLENTGTWLLELEYFRKWCDVQSTNGSERILCCYGIPGAGKTLIRYY